MNAVRSKKTSNKSRFLVALIAIFILIGAASFGLAMAINNLTAKNNTEDDSAASVEPKDEAIDIPTDEPAQDIHIQPIDFQPTVDSWATSVGGDKSVYIYDLDLDQVAGAYNTESNFQTASLYKLFVVYEGYKRVVNGDWDAEDAAGTTRHTIAECLDLAIRESNSECAETMRWLIGRDNLEAIIENDWGIKNSNISALISNTPDIAAIMRRFYEHPDFNNVAWLDRMWDSFLNQPVTEYDWRMGLPKGFSRATVYDKVGWDFNPDRNYWNIYNDAAIVKFPMEDGSTRDFVVVVMSNRVDYKKIRNLGQVLEEKFYEEKI